MKILIIDNNSRHIKKLIALVQSEGYVTDSIKWNDQNLLQKQKDYDVIILSGGRGLAVPDHREDLAVEMSLVKNTTKPVIGICLGFQIIADSYGAEMIRKNVQEKGLINIDVLHPEKIFEGKRHFSAFVAHK
jgi:GMP synthase-like glutamine amidotransferase